jgi:hypothetical protein
MANINEQIFRELLSEKFYYRGKGASKNRIKIFVSHRSADKDIAREISSELNKMGLDIYFDEKDPVLQNADKNGDDDAVIKCIEYGLQNCSHLLGIISENTVDSWWVPYEIGYTKGRGKDSAYLIQGSVSRIPSYMKISRRLASKEDVIAWAEELLGYPILLFESTFSRSFPNLEEYLSRSKPFE